jgi:hypothetical protein
MLRKADSDPLFTAPKTFLFLIFIVHLRDDRMVAIMDLVTQAIERRESEGVDSVSVIFPCPCKSELGTKIHEDIAGLGDDEIAVLEQRRSVIRWVCCLLALVVISSEIVYDGVSGSVHAEGSCVGIRDTGFLED